MIPREGQVDGDTDGEGDGARGGQVQDEALVNPREQQEQGQMEVQVLEWIGEHVNTAQDFREARCWGSWRSTGSGPWYQTSWKR